jgi:hypothetical protein
VNAESGWIIDVCIECQREAKWPFCEHRRVDGPWTVAVAVKPTAAAKTALAHAVAKSREEE